MNGLEEKFIAPKIADPLTQAYMTDLELRWEDIVNRPLLQQAIEQAGLQPQVAREATLLSPPYFKEALRRTGYPQPTDETGWQYMGGFVPRSDHLRATALPNLMIMQMGSPAYERGYLPQVVRHEYKHRYLPIVPQQRNYGYVYTPGLTEFLGQYPQEVRGEEQAAEAFAGRVMPEELKAKTLRDMYEWVEE